MLKTLDAAVYIRVEQGEAAAEMVLVALMRRRGHEQAGPENVAG
jgi:hypothetical protein